jgi:hypothetical protein
MVERSVAGLILHDTTMELMPQLQLGTGVMSKDVLAAKRLAIGLSQGKTN